MTGIPEFLKLAAEQRRDGWRRHFDAKQATIAEVASAAEACCGPQKPMEGAIAGRGAITKPPSAAIAPSKNAPSRSRCPIPEDRDDYPRLIAMVDKKTRVIECRDGLQWVLQRRSTRGWAARSFCRSREALWTATRRLLGLDRPAPKSEWLLAMPEHISSGGVGPQIGLKRPSRIPEVPKKVIADPNYPGMYRLRLPGGKLSDMVILTRARDVLEWHHQKLVAPPLVPADAATAEATS